VRVYERQIAHRRPSRALGAQNYEPSSNKRSPTPRLHAEQDIAASLARSNGTTATADAIEQLVTHRRAAAGSVT
jgi:hypothetical protein